MPKPTQKEKDEARRKARHSKEVRKQLRQLMTSDPTVKQLSRAIGRTREMEHGVPKTPMIEGKSGMLLRERTKQKRKLQTI